MNTKEKDWSERLVELVKDDKELHDATVRLINSMADLKQAQANRIKVRSGYREPAKRKSD